MKILVAVKRVIDPYVKIRIKSDNTGVEKQNIKMAMNPFDEIALEEALRLKEKNPSIEIIAISIGTDNSQETLRHALALGADKAMLVRTEKDFEPLNIAKILKKIIEEQQPSLVLMGKQSIDGDNNQTPQMLASLLDWPQATNASKVELTESFVEVNREIDGGSETLKLALPAIVSVDLRLNTPRYATLPNIMRVRSKPLLIKDLDSLDLNLKTHVEVLKVSAPPTRKTGIKVDSVAELLNKLSQEAKVL